MDWIGCFHAAGLPVCAPILNEGGRLIQTIREGSHRYYGVVFEEAGGHPITSGDLSSDLYYAHGRELEKLHQISKMYQGKEHNRRCWDKEDYFLRDVDDCIPERYRDGMHRRFSELREKMKSIRVTKNNYGIIHGDLGYSNMFLDDGRLVLFDFDNCTEAPFVLDIAGALYGSIFTRLRCESAGDRSAFESPRTGENLEKVWAPFREGYQSVNEWTLGWNEQLEVCFEILYFRSVMHAWRLLKPESGTVLEKSLIEDLDTILDGKIPVRFDFQTGKAVVY